MRLKPTGLRELLILIVVMWALGFAGVTLLYFQMGGLIG